MNSGWIAPEPYGWKDHVGLALAEDIGPGDFSAAALPEGEMVEWFIEAQEDGVLAGAGVAAYLLSFEGVDGASVGDILVDGSEVSKRTVVISGVAPAAELLTRERPALNYLMHLSGIASHAAKFVKAVEGTGCRIVDTRKTTPGLRYLQKYAVRCGGGQNHRMGLYDGIMIKDNHILAAGSISGAVEKAREVGSHMVKIEVECEGMGQVEEAVEAGADIVMLDNMAPKDMAEVVGRFKGKVTLEASGGITLATVREVAETGVDAISVGALTHSSPSLSLHLELR